MESQFYQEHFWQLRIFLVVYSAGLLYVNVKFLSLCMWPKKYTTKISTFGNVVCWSTYIGIWRRVLWYLSCLEIYTMIAQWANGKRWSAETKVCKQKYGSRTRTYMLFLIDAANWQTFHRGGSRWLKFMQCIVRTGLILMLMGGRHDVIS